MSEKPGIQALNDPARLHSRYNPQGEAARYIDSLNLTDNIKVFILIEPGLGYVIPLLREKFKESKIIVLHAENIQGPFEQGLPVLNSEDANEIQKFLETQIPETGAKNIRIIEWRPSMNFYKEAYVNILSQVVNFIKRIEAGKRTTAVFGKRWVQNFFKNLELVNKTLLYKETEIPVIITGSGPSLEKALPVIKKAQDSCLIIAASSSVTALSSFGIKTDIIITTDGGTWALKHMYSCYRNDNAPLAVNLCAALPSQFNDTPFLIINDGSFWQSIVLHELSLPSVIIPQKGTVTAAALELALQLTKGNIYLAGMDLSAKDIRTHVKPYSFDALLFAHANRFLPYYSESFTRSFLIHHGGSMEIYAQWFKKELSSWPKRIFSITESNVFERADLLKENSASRSRNSRVKNKSDFFKTAQAKEKSAFFYKRETAVKAADALLNALKNPEYADNIKQELASLLFEDGSNVQSAELEEKIREIAFKKAIHE